MISGQIESRPLPIFLFQLHQQRFTGEIAVQTEGGSAQIFLTEGAVAQVVLPDNRDLLGQVLREAGVISDAGLRRALATPAGPGRRFGDVLLDLGLIEEPRLLQGLRLQVGRRLGRLFLLQRGGYLAVDGAHQRGLQGDAPVLTPMLWAIAYAARTLPLEFLKALFASRMGARPRLLRERQIQLTGYGFDEVGQWLAQLLPAGERSIEELVAESGAPAQQVLAALFALQVTEALAWEGAPVVSARPPRSAQSAVPAPSAASAVPAPSTASAVPAPSTASALPTARSAMTPRPVSLAERALLTLEIEQRGQFIEQEDLFSVLGVPPDGDTEAVDSAYHALQQQFAAERLVQLGLGGMVRQAARLSQRFQEAHDLLRVPALREQQRRRLSQREPELEETLQKARAKLAFSRGVVLLRNREFALSIPEFRAALRLRPDDGEILGHLAWAEYGAGLRGRDECRRRILEAIERTPTAAPLYYFAGVIYKVEGEEESALKCFAECCKRDSKSQAAASELRLLLLRKVRAATKSSQSAKLSSQSGRIAGLLRPSSQSQGPGKPGKPSSQSQVSGKLGAGPGKGAKPEAAKEDTTAALLDALKQATTTEELLSLWQKAEKALPDSGSKRSADSSRGGGPRSAESVGAQRRGGLDFLRRPLGESLRALVDLLQQPIGGAPSSRSAGRPAPSSSSSVPRPSAPSSRSAGFPGAARSGSSFPSASSNPSGGFRGGALNLDPALLVGPLATGNSDAELALLAGEVPPASATSAGTAPPPPSAASAAPANPSTASGRSLVELLQMPLAGNLKAILTTPITGLKARSGSTPPAGGAAAPSSQSAGRPAPSAGSTRQPPPPIPGDARGPRKG